MEISCSPELGARLDNKKQLLPEVEFAARSLPMTIQGRVSFSGLQKKYI